MSHYFENDPNLKDDHQTISFDFHHQLFHLVSSSGVFSKDKLDTGTRILLDYVIEHERPNGDVLDLGCGIGVVGVVLSRFWHCHVTGIDINPRAAALATLNYCENNVEGEVLTQDGLDSKDYDCILLNPPIRTGKDVIYRLFSQCAAHLKPHGNLFIVMRKQHGAASAVTYLEQLGLQVERVARDKGFWVLKVRHSHSENEN